MFFVHSNLMASHIVGGEMYYDCLGGNQYRVTVKLYRDCLSDGADFDDPIPITVFNGSFVQIDNFTIPFPGKSELDVNFNGFSCITLPDDICIEEAVYQRVVTLPPSTNGYILVHQRCCRGPEIINLNNPVNQGLTLMATIPAPGIADCNSSPRYNNIPPLLLCMNEELVFDHSATDPDGDEIVYELCTPFLGGTQFNPAPNPADAPPYDFINWDPDASATNPFINGSININSSTGLLTATPEMAGNYVVGICANEYRDGVLINTTRRDFLFRVMSCEIELAASIVPQESMSSFTSYCQGLTINFENTSFGGTSYQWDFGDPATTADVSTEFSPSYTYPEPGTYEVTLIVSIEGGCTDTTKRSFTINHEVTSFFEPPDPQCVTGNSFDFEGGGVFPSGADFEWDFGNFATPISSTELNPTGIVFTQLGSVPISYTINYESCSETYTDNIFVFTEPSIQFSLIDELKCAPYYAVFNNLSYAQTPIYAEWDFGDGSDFQNQLHGTHTYLDEGLYDVTLTIWTDSGCIDTLTMTKTNYVEIFPKPTSLFEVSPDQQDEYNAIFEFTDLSIDSETHWYHFGDGDFTPLRNTSHYYYAPGYYYPYQIVENIYGCRDTSTQTVLVVPVIPIMIPNAFTPDGDHLNTIFQPILYSPQEIEIWIWNRWGELVYYVKEWEASWDGTDFTGKELLEGVYVYKVRYHDFNHLEVPIEVNGHVSLLK